MGGEGRKWRGGREGEERRRKRGHFPAMLKRNVPYKSLRILLFGGFVLHFFYLVICSY